MSVVPSGPWRRKQVFLEDWRIKLDEFLRFNERDVLDGAGRIRHEEALAAAEAEYERFAARRRALLEARGERDGVEALEAVAKHLEPPGERPDRGRG